MKTHIALLTAAIFAIAALSGCNPRKVDEKLDTTYQVKKQTVENLLGRVDSLHEKILLMRTTHERQDEVIDEHQLSPQDDSLQAKQEVWFIQFEHTLDSSVVWQQETRKLFTVHQSMEADHEEEKIGEIRADHDLMMAQLDSVENVGERYFKELAKADTTVQTFFDEHMRLAEKYGIELEKFPGD